MAVLTALLGAALPAASAWALGRFLTHRLALPATLRFAVGAAILSTVTFFLLLAGIATPAAFVTLSLLALGALLIRRPAWTTLHPPPWWAAALCVLYGGLYLLYALTPETQGDALHYHLSLAVEARSSGAFPSRIAFYDVLPQGAEALFAYAYSIGGDAAARLFSLAFLLATVPLSVHTARQLALADWQGWFAGLFYAVTPVAGVSSTCAFNDSAVAFFILATFALLLEWRLYATRALLPLAGLTAGFCYALKFTGGLIAPAVLLAILARRQWRGALRFAAFALLPPLPWVIRAAFLTGNPLAPLLNRFFPNPWFHIESERLLGEYLRHYGAVDWQTIPLELTFYGDLLQGLLGPAWLLAPIALLALRRRPGAALVSAAIYAVLPWFLNIGARFLMPGMPFAALALAMALPRIPALAVLAAHAVLSFPLVIPTYTPPNAWALPPEIPWRAALRLESEDSYRTRKAPGYPLVSLLHQHTQPGDRILDLAIAPAALIRRELIASWESALGDRLVAALQMGASPDRGLLDSRTWQGQRTVRSLRLRFPAAQPTPAAVHEVLFEGPAGPLRFNVLSTAAAWPNIWEAPLAFDGNPVTAWSTAEPVRAGMFVEVELPGPQPLTAVRILTHASARRLPLEAFTSAGSGWQPLPLEGPKMLEARNYRDWAIRYLRREKIRFILAADGLDGTGLLGKSLAGDPAGWGLQPAGSIGNITLYRVY